MLRRLRSPPPSGNPGDRLLLDTIEAGVAACVGGGADDLVQAVVEVVRRSGRGHCTMTWPC